MKSLEAFFNPMEIRKIGDETFVCHSSDYTQAIPIVNKVPYFNEADFFVEKLMQEKCDQLKAATMGKAKEYEQFVRQKGRRPVYDIYACFQSFNEAFKAFFPFIKSIKNNLKEGDVILNLWDRTGWLASFLQGLFPQQKVISLWEGDKDVLGYKGFHFWYGQEESSFQIAFANLEKPLPFKDNSIALVFGLDTLHRFDISLLLAELIRITTSEAPIIFPHVHLTNNEPEPFFERGCRQLHGLEYDSFFQLLFKQTDRQGFVFPEPEMFSINELDEKKDRPIISQPNTSHYNSTIAILPKHWSEKETLSPYRFEDFETPEKCYLLVNPLLTINYPQQQLYIDRTKYADRVGYLLDRHPIYMEKLNKADGYLLSDNQTKILYLANSLKRVDSIAEDLGIDLKLLLEEIKDLQERDVVQLAPVTAQQIRLQHFVSTQEYLLSDSEQTLKALWKRAVDNFSDQIFLSSELDESEFSYEDAHEILQKIQSCFAAAEIQVGDRIVVLSNNHFEAILSILAAVNMGIVAVPVEHKLSTSHVAQILEEVAPKMIFVDDESAENFKSLWSNKRVIEFDTLSEENLYPLFSDWISETETILPLSMPSPGHQDLAVILYTSGSTGRPKGVMLSHGHMVRSSRLVTENFHWNKEDRFFAIGELDSMSGLRNACFAPIEVGSSVIIPTMESKRNLFSITESIRANKATILGTTPALLNQMVKFEKRIKGDLHTLRQVICTGSALSVSLKNAFHQYFGIGIINYYGLTETTGICITEMEGEVSLDQNTIGKSCACIAQVVDEKGQLLKRGEQGELRIYGINIMQGYYKSPSLTNSVIKNNWFYTGDKARILEDGKIELLGRKKEVIKTPDGKLIYATEIELVLESHALIKEAAVLAIPEEEKMQAYIVLMSQSNPAEDLVKQLKDFVKEKIGNRNISIAFTERDQIIRNANGKVIKSKLK